MTGAPAATGRARRFSYTELAIDAGRSELTCRYELDGQEFTERVTIEGVPATAWERPGVAAAARLAYLLCGASYYKAGAPPVIDLGGLALDAPDLEFLRQYYVEGLGEFAYRNGLDLSGIEFRSTSAAEPARTQPPTPAQSSSPAQLSSPAQPASPAQPSSPAQPAPPGRSTALRPLVPFGGGIDSIVTTELVRRRVGDDNTVLFVVSKAADRYAAVEAPAAVAGLPVVRAERRLDARILRSAELGYLNGHVPVTGIISAIAVLAALLHGRDAVVMSNEASASAGNIIVGDRVVNHQWSKGIAFESGLRAALDRHGVPVEYFSFLRSASELWVARHFAAVPQYHRAFRSCNRAFYVDPALRLDHWCGVCDKCCFVDLVLAPFMDRSELAAVFGGHEPLAEDTLADQFRTLLGSSSSPKPFDCVGDVPECRAALRLTAARPDRAGDALVHRLAAELPDDTAPTTDLMRPSGPHFIPDDYAPGDLLV
jgi:hypothetical protein